jgi:hypothetical protein
MFSAGDKQSYVLATRPACPPPRESGLFCLRLAFKTSRLLGRKFCCTSHEPYAVVLGRRGTIAYHHARRDEHALK